MVVATGLGSVLEGIWGQCPRGPGDGARSRVEMVPTRTGDSEGCCGSGDGVPTRIGDGTQGVAGEGAHRAPGLVSMVRWRWCQRGWGWCPQCSESAATMGTARAEFGDRTKWSWRQCPQGPGDGAHHRVGMVPTGSWGQHPRRVGTVPAGWGPDPHPGVPSPAPVLRQTPGPGGETRSRRVGAAPAPPGGCGAGGCCGAGIRCGAGAGPRRGAGRGARGGSVHWGCGGLAGVPPPAAPQPARPTPPLSQHALRPDAPPPPSDYTSHHARA